MSKSKKMKLDVSSKAESQSADDIELVLGRLWKYLNWKSQSPIEDANKIESLIDEFRSQYVRAEQSSPKPGDKSPEPFKDEARVGAIRIRGSAEAVPRGCGQDRRSRAAR